MFRKIISKNWSHIRTLLVTIHLLAIILKAIPAPEGAMNRSDWKNPTVQAEFSVLAKRFNDFGISTTPEKLEDQLWSLGQSYMAVRRKSLKPFRFYYRYFGADQNWRLFVAPHMYPSRLNIEIRENGEWRTIYQPFNKETRWQAHLIENSRFRPSVFRYSWGRYKKHYSALGEYLANKAASDFPEATAFRTRWWNARSPSPQQVLQHKEPKGKWQYPLIFDLSQYKTEQTP